MSKLFSTPEDPWALPTPKQWDNEPVASDTEHPLHIEQHEPDDEDEQEERQQQQGEDESDRLGGTEEDGLNVTSTSPVLENAALEGSIWGDDNAILGGSTTTTTNKTGNTTITNSNLPTSSDFHSWSEAVRTSYSAISSDVITITEMEERQGILFKHTNYLIEHHVPLEGEQESPINGERRVVRRYSDFVWLLEVLLKRYTFRLVPELPPKKLASGSDPLFLERRRRGLSRFLNALVRHPVLRSEPLVVMFLTAPTDLAGWRRQAQYDSSEEFVDRKSSPHFIQMWRSSHEEFQEMINSTEEELKDAIENWNRICIVIERLSVRSKQIASDHARLSSLFTKFKDSTQPLYPVEESRTPQINEGLRQASNHVTTAVSTLEEEAINTDTKVLEEFKRHLDYLWALKTLFDRNNRLGGNSIEHLNKRKEHNEQKLAELQGNPDARGTEVDKLTDSIRNDIKEIARQTNRDWLIKENFLTEFVMFQETQFQITRALQHWARDRLLFSEKHLDNWTSLSSVIQDMPLTRSE